MNIIWEPFDSCKTIRVAVKDTIADATTQNRGGSVRTHPALEDEYIDVSYTPFYSDRRVAAGGSLFRYSLILAEKLFGLNDGIIWTRDGSSCRQGE